MRNEDTAQQDSGARDHPMTFDQRLRRRHESDRTPALVSTVGLSIIIATTYDSPALAVLPRFVAEILIPTLPVLGGLISARRLAHRPVSLFPLVVAGAFSVSIAMSVLLSSLTTLGATLTLSTAFAALTFVATGVFLTARDVVAIARLLIVVAIAQSAVAIAEVQLRAPWAIAIASGEDGYLSRPNLIVDGILRATASMGHPILLGVVCSAGVLLAFVRGVVPARWIQVGIVATCGWGVLLSGSRSSAAALALGLVVLFLHRASPLRRNGRVLVGVLAVPAIVYYIVTTYERALLVSPFSVSNRTDAWSRLLETFARPTLTVFFGENRSFTLETVADNQFLTVAGRFGLVGLALLVIAAVYAASSPVPMVAAMSTFLAMLFLSFDSLGFGLTTILFWMFVGLARRSFDFPNSQPPRGRQGRRRSHEQRRGPTMTATGIEDG